MKKQPIIFELVIAFSSLIASIECTAQDTTIVYSERISAGIGIGLNYGGIGANVLAYPHQNIGLFVGVGYAFAGVGSNVGVKVKLSDGPKVSPHLLGMYGYNAAIKVKGGSAYNRMFYGASLGFGIDLKPKSYPKNYLSIALLVPIRSSEVDDYIDALNNTGSIKFENNLMAVAFSVGCHMIIK